MRTEYCGRLRLSHVERQVTLCGWVSRRRDLGSLIFYRYARPRRYCASVLQSDRYGRVKALASELRNEFCIQVTGTVRARDAKNIQYGYGATGE